MSYFTIQEYSVRDEEGDLSVREYIFRCPIFQKHTKKQVALLLVEARDMYECEELVLKWLRSWPLCTKSDTRLWTSQMSNPAWERGGLPEPIPRMEDLPANPAKKG